MSNKVKGANIINKAIKSITKPKLKSTKPKQAEPKLKSTKPKQAKVELMDSIECTAPTIFSSLPVLNEEKSIIANGIISLNRSLYEQTVHESNRLLKLRKIIGNIEESILDEKYIESLSPDKKLRIYEILRKDSGCIVDFLERMQKNSLQVALIFDIHKNLMEVVDDKSESNSAKSLSTGIDKDKVTKMKITLLNLLNSK